MSTYTTPRNSRPGSRRGTPRPISPHNSRPNSRSRPGSPSATFERFERRLSLENLLKEAQLDRDSLLHILRENPVAIADLDASKIQCIIKQAKQQKLTPKISLTNNANTNPFANIDTNETKKSENINNAQIRNNAMDTNEMYQSQMESIPQSHFGIIRDEFTDLRTRISKLQKQMTLESYAHNTKQKTEYNNRILALQTLSQQKKDITHEFHKRQQNFDSEKSQILQQISDIETDMNSERSDQQNLLLKKIALQQTVIKNEGKLRDLLAQKKRFSEMRDISQFKPIAVFYVLKYLEIRDFVHSILCCKAWYFSLNKPAYFRILTRNVIVRHRKRAKKQKSEPNKVGLVSNETKLKRINHAVMQLKIDKPGKKSDKKNKNSKTPRPDDIYSQCMQQLQKVIAQSIQDREELEDRVKAQMGILKFMQTSMYNKMNELSRLRVRKWELMDRSYNQYTVEKKDLHSEIKELEQNLNKNREIIDNIKANMIGQKRMRETKLKIQKDLRGVRCGTTSIEQTNELKKLKQQMKKLSQVMVKLRQEIPKRSQEVKKYKNRVELLESQYKQYSQQPLP